MDNIIPLRPGAKSRVDDDFVQYVAEKLNDFADAHGCDPQTFVFVMWADPKEEGGDFMYSRARR